MLNAVFSSDGTTRKNAPLSMVDRSEAVAEYDISSIPNRFAKDARYRASLEYAGPTNPTIFDVNTFLHALYQLYS